MRDTIVVAGALAQKPRRGGHAWVLMQYVLGLRRLGWDVLLLDQVDWSVGPGRVAEADQAAKVAGVLALTERFGLRDAYALIGQDGETVGLPRQGVLERVGRSALLLNVMGFLSDEEVLARARRRVFLDIDPGFGQMWRELGLCDLFRGHDAHVTIGENVGQPDCLVPTCGRRWITTRQPVVLDLWPPTPPPDDGPFTTVASWRGAYGPVAYLGRTFGLRVHEFRRFVELPRATGRRFRVALDIHPADGADLALLRRNDWEVVDPVAAAGDPWSYRSFVQASGAEFSVAKNMYVQARSGWFSDRSICYLASGRPVVVQDTGIGQFYPAGAGLLTFDDPEEARAGVEAVVADYPRHARAARAVAEECFDSDRVLGHLLGRLGVAR